MNNEDMTMMGVNDDMLDSFVQDEVIDENEEKLKELNKNLPKWSLEPPTSFLK